MNDTQAKPENIATVPGDPAMAASDPAMFAPLTREENNILRAHLNSGWHKQSAVYPVLSEPWRETCTVIHDLGRASDIAWQAEHEPEAGQ